MESSLMWIWGWFLITTSSVGHEQLHWTALCALGHFISLGILFFGGFYFGCSYRTSCNSTLDKELNCLCLASQKDFTLPVLVWAILVTNQPRKFWVPAALSREHNSRGFIITQALGDAIRKAWSLPIHQWQGHSQKDNQSRLLWILNSVCPSTTVLLRLIPKEIFQPVKFIII